VLRFPRTLTCALFASAFFAPAFASAAVPAAPQRWVTDDAGFLTPSTRDRLDGRLEAYEEQTGHQVLVWIGRTTAGVPVEDFSVSAFRAWRVGGKGRDDGLVLFVFTDDRKVRIEVGYGLEGQVPDAIASRIIREAIVPRMQAGDRDGAIVAGVDALVAAVEGRASPASSGSGQASPDRGPPFDLPSLGLAQKILIGIAAAGFLVLLVTHPSLALYLLFTMLSGGRGGGSGGRRRFAGGGGRSGGGGATGSW
jgi:uncharacterized protein